VWPILGADVERSRRIARLTPVGLRVACLRIAKADYLDSQCARHARHHRVSRSDWPAIGDAVREQQAIRHRQRSRPPVVVLCADLCRQPHLWLIRDSDGEDIAKKKRLNSRSHFLTRYAVNSLSDVYRLGEVDRDDPGFAGSKNALDFRGRRLVGDKRDQGVGV
jgi:hypothetical protein